MDWREMLRHAPIDCDAQEGFLCITIKSACFCYCGTLQYSALVIVLLLMNLIFFSV